MFNWLKKLLNWNYKYKNKWKMVVEYTEPRPLGIVVDTIYSEVKEQRILNELRRKEILFRDFRDPSRFDFIYNRCGLRAVKYKIYYDHILLGEFAIDRKIDDSFDINICAAKWYKERNLVYAELYQKEISKQHYTKEELDFMKEAVRKADEIVKAQQDEHKEILFRKFNMEEQENAM